MPDDSISSGSSETTSSETELSVPVDTLLVDGVAPDVGDPITVKVNGSVTRVVNGVVFMKPERVNDQPMPSSPTMPAGEPELDRLERLSREVSLP